jgi:hypothetical protein
MGGIVKKIFRKSDRLAPTPGAGTTSKQATGIASGARQARQANLRRQAAPGELSQAAS